MPSSTENYFKAKITSRGYHVFKETTWNNVKEGDSVKVDLETTSFQRTLILTHVELDGTHLVAVRGLIH